MDKKQEKLLLFDADGTVIKSFQQTYTAVRDFIKSHSGKDITEEEYRAFFETNPLDNVLKAAGMETKKKLTKEEIGDFFKNYKDSGIFDEIDEVLKVLVKNNILCIITSSLIEFVTKELEEHNMVSLFAAFMGPQTAVHKNVKIKMAMEEFGHDKDSTFFISDTSGDILAAKKVGVNTVGVTWGYHGRDRMEKVKPDYIVDTPEELLKVLND